MLGPVDYVIWLAVTLADLLCLLCVLKKSGFSRHFTIVLFLSSSIAVSVARYLILIASGLTSVSYFYFYYYSDAVLTICLFFVLMGFYGQVFSEMSVSKQMRTCAMLLLGGTALISYHMVASSSDRLITRFAFEMSQNLYFLGVVLTYVLWGAMMKLRENRTHLMQLVLGLGVFLSVFAGSYALRNMYPDLAVWKYFIHIIALWLPASWAYTFVKVPEDARMATAQVVAPTPR
jgi:hypothetical protein